MPLRALFGALENELEPVYLVMGDAGLLVSRAERAIVEAVLPHAGLPAFNHAVYRAGDDRDGASLSCARTLPMMAKRRLVVVRAVHEASSSWLSSLLDYVKEPSPTTTLVVTGQKFPSVRKGGADFGARVRNAVKKKGYFQQIKAKDIDPVGFAMAHAGDLNKELRRRDAQLLVELVGEDLARLATEVDKVALFVGDARQIRASDLEEVCSLVAEAVVWDLTAGIAARDPDLALKALHRLLEGGDAAHKLLSMVAWQLRQLLKVSELERRGAPEAVIRKQVRMRNDQYRRIRRALGPNAPDAADVMRRLARVNRAMNFHRAGDRRVLEAFVVDLCTGAV